MSKFLEPRSYVREFNAASIEKAIMLADEALRIDGVTVAVWKNRLESLQVQEQTSRLERITQFTNQAFAGTLKHSKYMLKNRNYYLLQSDFGAKQESYLVSFIEALGGNHSFLPTPYPTEKFLPFTERESNYLSNKFHIANLFLRVELGHNDLKIHKDGGYPTDLIDELVLFRNQFVRMIENFEGSPTAFYPSEDGGKKEDMYLLPKGAAAFFHPRNESVESAWHSATLDEAKRRSLMLLDLNVF